MRAARLSVLMTCLCGCGGDNAEVVLDLRLAGPNVAPAPPAGTLDTATYLIGSSELAVVEVGVFATSADAAPMGAYCVALTTASGRLSCPGPSCVAVLNPSSADGGAFSEQRVLLNLPVEGVDRRSFPIYEAPTESGYDVITGELYSSDCSSVLQGSAAFIVSGHIAVETQTTDMGTADLELNAVD